MSRNTIISVVLGGVVTIALGAWLISGEPFTDTPKINVAKSLIDSKVQSKSGKKTFKFAQPKATALNNEPVNIVIDSGNRNSPLPVSTGSADLVVKSSKLRMRSEPSSRSETINQYKRGSRFVLIKDEKGWALVQSLDDGQKGWMFKKYMKAGG